MTVTATITKNEQSQDNTVTTNDHDETLRQITRKRRSAPNDNHTNKSTNKNINKSGSNKYDQQRIVVVFAKFHEELHTSTATTQDHEDSRNQPRHTMTSSTMQSLDDSIHQLMKSEASDTRSVSPEMIKTPTQESKQTVKIVQQSHQTKRSFFSEIASFEDQSYLHEWRLVIFVERLTHVLNPYSVHTLQPTLLQSSTTQTRRPTVDQASFRPCHSTTDHSYTFQQLKHKQMAIELYQPLWVAAIDLKKKRSAL